MFPEVRSEEASYQPRGFSAEQLNILPFLPRSWTENEGVVSADLGRRKGGPVEFCPLAKLFLSHIGLIAIALPTRPFTIGALRFFFVAFDTADSAIGVCESEDDKMI